MKALSILELPKYWQELAKKNLLGVTIDYRRYNIKRMKIIDEIRAFRFRANDSDNSDVVYDGMIAYKRVRSPRGLAHSIICSIEGIGPVPFAFVEEYAKGQGLQGSVGRIDFTGAYFLFRDIIPKEYREMEETLYGLGMDQDGVRVTRQDVAFDFALEFPQNGHNWIKPAKTSKREIDIYKHNGLFNSFGYLAEKNSSYGVRMYDKVVDITRANKNKVAWYGGADKIPTHWTRIEFELYPPYSLKDEKDLIRDLARKVLNDEDIDMGTKFRPCAGFVVENCYDMLERYAYRHGVTMTQLIEELIHEDDKRNSIS